MSRGKYSPFVNLSPNRQFIYNAQGLIPDTDFYEYNEELHFPNYDKDGFDSYGYSAYNIFGKYVGPCNGVDVKGFTENDYLIMDADEFYNL